MPIRGLPKIVTVEQKARTLLNHHRARARKVFSADKIDYGVPELVEAINAATGRPCEWCLSPLYLGNVQIDHLTPTSRGGSFAYHNLTVMCSTCNRRKGKLNLQEWKSLIEAVRQMAPDGQADVWRRLESGAAHWRHIPKKGKR